MNKDDLSISFWRWFRKGSGDKPGYTRVVRWSLAIHFVMGVIIGQCVDKPLWNVSETCLLPTLSILIGLTFAWIGNAQGLLQSKATRELGLRHKGGYIEFVFMYQLAVLVLLATVVVLAFTALQPLPTLNVNEKHPDAYVFLEASFYGLISLAISTVWKTVNGTHYLLRANIVVDEVQSDSTDP